MGEPYRSLIVRALVVERVTVVGSAIACIVISIVVAPLLLLVLGICIKVGVLVVRARRQIPHDVVRIYHEGKRGGALVQQVIGGLLALEPI